MKRIATFIAMVALVAVANAASINWSISLGRSGKITDSTGANLAGSIYLVLSSDVAALEAASSVSDFEQLLSSDESNSTPPLATVTVTAGKPSPSSGTASSSRLTAGTEYTYAFVVYDNSTKKFYVSGTATEAAFDPNSTDESLKVEKSISFTTDHIGSTYASSDDWGTAGSGGETIPEPATGALALAGVALLFKRRRA